MAQKPPTRSDWERLIVKIAGAFGEASIPYHLDASTALYVQGIDFEMDDLDITVKWGCLDCARKLFIKRAPSPISSTPSPSFHFDVDGLKVDVLAYESPTGLGDPADRVQISVAGVRVWTKTVDFYRRHMRADHPLANLVSEHFRNQQS